jgi:hypothetical protein
VSPALLFRLAWPDVLERTRRAGFLLTVGTTVWLGSLVYTNNIQMWVGEYRGVVNSAWLGTLMALSATTFVSLAGFYVVKNAVERDRLTGVGQILAATRVSTRAYLLAKWLSNFAVLAAVVLTLAVAAVVLHYLQAETVRLDLGGLLAPLALLALPAMAAIAAAAVLFETVPWLSGGAGNVAYFFLWNAALAVPLVTRTRWADWTGIGLVEASLLAAVHARAPAATGGISFTAGPSKDLSHLAALDWAGIEWDASSVGLRFSWIAVAALVVIGASLWFDRFDSAHAANAAPAKRKAPAQGRPWRRSLGALPALTSALWALVGRAISARNSFGAMVVAELRLAFSGVSRWWTLVAAGLWVASMAAPMAGARYVHVVTWLWPVLLWSRMGVRESLHRTAPLVYSCPGSLQRQFVALWVSGIVIAVVAGSGLAIRLILAGDLWSLAAWLAGALFVPSLALALGVWTGSTRTFEALYVVLWYVGPANRIAALDYSGAWAAASAFPTAAVYGGLAAVLFAASVVGRRRQIQG